MQPLVVIPARLQAARLPGKPLADIAGKTMIARMVEIARAADVGPVVVAAGEPDIAAEAARAGAHAILTDPALPSGTDRVHAAVAGIGAAPEIVINLQGDMPTMAPAAIRACAQLLDDTDADIATLCAASDDPQDRETPNVVKAILAEAPDWPCRRALYFTRAAAPWGEGPIWRHVGIYAFRWPALQDFVAASPSALERREKLEQLRALELGQRIAVGEIATFPKGVDTQADLEAARLELAGR